MQRPKDRTPLGGDSAVYDAVVTMLAAAMRENRLGEAVVAVAEALACAGASDRPEDLRTLTLISYDTAVRAMLMHLAARADAETAH